MLDNDRGTSSSRGASVTSLPNAAEARKAKADRKRASKYPMTQVERLAAGISLEVPLAAQKRDPKSTNNQGEN